MTCVTIPQVGRSRHPYAETRGHRARSDGRGRRQGAGQGRARSDHGLGPHATTQGGKPSTPRQDLKDAYSTIEEAKAYVTGLWALAYMMDKGQLKDTLGQGAAPVQIRLQGTGRFTPVGAVAEGWSMKPRKRC